MHADPATDLESNLTLQRVRFYEISAKLVESTPATEGAENKVERDDPGDKLDIELAIRNEAKRVGFRVAADYADDRVAARIDCAVFFTKSEAQSNDLDPDELAEFAATHGIPILVPYLREALAESTRRIVGHAVTLGMVSVSDVRPTGRYETDD